MRTSGRAFALGVLIVAHAATANARGLVAVTTDDPECIRPEALAVAVSARGATLSSASTTRLLATVHTNSDGLELDVIGESSGRMLEARHLVAASCVEAVDALGLIAALATEDAQPVEQATATPVSIAVTPEHDSSALDPPPTSRVYASVGWAGSSFGGGSSGPRVAVGTARRRTWLPWLEGAAAFSLPAAAHGGGGSVDLSWLTVRTSAGVVGGAIGRDGFASLYASFDGGTVFAAGSGPPKVERQIRPWFAGGGGARLRWTVGRLLVDGMVGASLPFARDRFVFRNGGTAYQVPGIGADAALAVGMLFP